MLLYHGSNVEIDLISLEKCRPYKDFGQGFYLTDIETQAFNMARRVSRIYGGTPVVNMFEIDDDFTDRSDLKIKCFGNKPSEEWATFVMNNRNREFKSTSDVLCNLDFKYDIVIGPVADDDMAMLFRQYLNEMIDFSTLIKGMTFKETTSQYSFHTDRAISLLKKAGVVK